MILEPVGHAIGGSDIDSTGGLLEKIERANEELEKNANICVETPDLESARKTSAKPKQDLPLVGDKVASAQTPVDLPPPLSGFKPPDLGISNKVDL